MFLSWIILIIGIEIGIRTDTFNHLFPNVYTNKLRFNCYFATWILALILFWSGANSFSAWYIMMLALILLPLAKNLLKYVRKSLIPAKSLAFLDLILLNMKAGNSFRKSFSTAMEMEKSWFTGFQLSLLKSFELGQYPETESKWFNVWAQEVIRVEKSRNKVIEQLEVLRRYSRQEMTFKKKLQNATSGPRAQMIVMSLLFLALNVFAIKNLTMDQIKTLFPMAWFLFLTGFAVIAIIMRSFKWKV